jgi:hypothetical protein
MLADQLTEATLSVGQKLENRTAHRMDGGRNCFGVSLYWLVPYVSEKSESFLFYKIKPIPLKFIDNS